MLRIEINNLEKKNLLMELVDEFLPPDSYEIVNEVVTDDADIGSDSDVDFIRIASGEQTDLNSTKRKIYEALAERLGKGPDWGILTGVRPVKLAGELTEKLGRDRTNEILKNDYLLSDKKSKLILDIYDYQKESAGNPDASGISLYIGIPFCPTRCSYCAFASNQEDYSEIKRYLDALDKELNYVAEEMAKEKLFPESIYIGGGTPTILSTDDLNSLMAQIKEKFDLNHAREYTVEAGRPDTINTEKLAVIKEGGAGRISINPQSMKPETMELIGRFHTPGDIERAFTEAADIGFDAVNMDLIAGLPGESPEDFKNSLLKIAEMRPENITIHSLAVKRASRLREEDPLIYRRQSDAVREMVDEALHYLKGKEYMPYYLYRQKHMAGACENIGYSLPGKEGLYNIRIMDEHQSNIALGAGGISKVYYPQENRLERVANVTNYREYINRIDEMIERKKRGIFNAFTSG